MITRAIIIAAMLGVIALAAERAPAAGARGEQVYAVRCAPCHKGGLLGAPKTGDPVSWAPRLDKGTAVLLDHSLNGFGDLMQPRGGSSSLSDEEVRDALAYMLASVGVSLDDPAMAEPRGGGAPADSEAAAAAVLQPAAAPAPATAAPPEAASPAPPAPPKAAGTTPTPAPTPTPATTRVAAAPARPAGVNAFNRLMKPPSERNPPPTEDGIHDPANPGTAVLQPPRESFSTLPKSKSGNRVDWVEALRKGLIAPRFDLVDPDKQPVVMDLNIVREVKGSMPDVVYPHKQHTEWLDCSNCHPAIFKPQKGANPMSMANILLGKQCGVCHGRVAFPVGECRKCHSGKKTKGTVAK
jgi:c(7)-type cytochrome triheme protein